nr:hypothetical protein [Micromonospora sp. DSM 115978]
MTVNLTPRAADALDSACRRSLQNRTDAINRALVVLVMVLDIQARSDGRLSIVGPEGGVEHIYIV